MYRLVGVVGTSRIVTRLHAVAYRLLGGAGPLGRNFGVRNVILTTTGRRTGRRREVPLYAFEDGSRVVVIGSNAGGHEPAWIANLRANPGAHLRVGRAVRAVRAREAEPPERDRLWAMAVDGFPGYALYQEQTPRPIPVVVLERHEDS